MTDETQANDAAPGENQRDEAEAAAAAEQAAAAEAAKAEEGKQPAPTIAGSAGEGAGEAAGAAQTKAEGNDTGWPDDWRQRLAGGNKGALKTLERFTSPDAFFGAYSEMRSRLDSGEVIRKPGKDASDEEKAAFFKAIGVPEKPTEYIDNLTLPDGMAMSKEDKEILGQFAESAHAAGAPQSVIDAAGSWYLGFQREQADALDKQDRDNAREATEDLKGEWRGDFEQNVRVGQMLFKDAPGGTEASGEGLFARLMGGRMADGRRIGDDPQMLRWMATQGREMYPAASVTGAGDGSPTAINDRLKELHGWMQAGDAKYWKDDDVQKEYRELLDAQQKMSARG